MKIAVTGSSGFVGRRVCERLQAEGHTIIRISLRNEIDTSSLAGVGAAVHLAGEPIAQRWTGDARRRIMESRREGTRRLVAALGKSPPNVLVSASAVGYYGDRGDEILTETSRPGSGFLCNVALAWEE